MFADEHHVNQACQSQGDTDLCEFKESESAVAGLFQSAGCDDVRRRTYQGDDTANAAGECQRHQFGRSRDLCCCAHAQYYRQ